jgi:hypothetical protein
MTAKTSAHDEPRLLVARPPHAMTTREGSDGRSDYTSRRYQAMRGEPEAVADDDLAAFADAAHDNDAGRAGVRVKHENGTLCRCTRGYAGQFAKLRDALHSAEALPNAERSLNLARRITHDLENLVKSLT